MTRTTKTLAIVALAVTTVAAGRAADDTWIKVGADELSPAQVVQLEKAKEAKSVLAKKVMGDLKSAMDAGSLSEAIGVCRDVAPQAAQQVGMDMGVAIGRTSHRVRNPENRPPQWAQGLVADVAATPQILTAPDGRMGVLIPIKTAGVCTRCHGPEDSLDAQAAATILEHYPDDEATGFEEGDVRGWFWVEVPGELELRIEN